MRRRFPPALTAVIAFAFLAVGLLAQGAKDEQGIPDKSYKSLSPLPIVMYDPDIGFGYGLKAKFVDFLGRKESFDLILFNSSKGERWYVFTFSLPDIEIRQGRKYGLSLDVKAEYDKYLNYTFYGVGQDSLKSEKTIFTHETKSLQLMLGRGFTPHFAAELSYTFRGLTYENVREGTYADLLKSFGKQRAPFASVVLRYDTSDSQIHPTRGFRLQFQDDLSAGFLGSQNSEFNRVTLDFRKYMLVFGEKDVFAFRTLVQYVSGDQIPYFDLSLLGGGSTMNVMRGFSLNRFMDKGKFLANVEYRFPLVWESRLPLGMKLGGIVFVDAGTVWPSLDKVDFGKMAVDAGLGLRIYMPDFVVRVDVGFGKDGMGLYFNFGHAF